MARKMKKSTSRFLSVLFHLVVLACIVMLYDAGKSLIDRYKPAEAAKEKIEEVAKTGKDTPEGTKEGKKEAPQGTTMADLMKQKAERERKKKAGNQQ